MLEICALASGSNGNCYYIGNQTEAILIDMGISIKQLIHRFADSGLDICKVRAIFLSHEHSDHSRGIRVLSKRLGISTFMTSRTYYALPKSYRPEYIGFFQANEVVEAGSFKIHSVLKNHDAAEPCSFRIEYRDKHVGVFTDIGHACANVVSSIRQCHALFLEANYDEKMLWEGSYPWYLKKRVASDVGHLSNLQAFETIRQHAHPELECIFLSHISKENNTPQLAIAAFDPVSKKITVKLTDRYAAAEVYKLSGQ
ncbi:MAG: MBL fold metallo-hydrolase [Prolixibacteraceae bacterium]|nr:MBL fold metallo-hydrolase [Prolixibacteraceae bacterium]